jgi:hypothetical protein
MKFTFDYEETLVRRVNVDADNLGDAIAAIRKMIDDETIVLDAEDFCGGKISLPLDENSPYYVRVEKCGETVEDVSDLDIVIEEW